MRRLVHIIAAGVLAASACGAQAQGAAGYRLEIVAPADDATVFNDSGDVVVKTSVVPPLAPGDQVELLVDGLPAAPPAATLEFPLAGLVRGPHQVQARIIDATGNVGSISPSSAFDMWEASRLFPSRHGK
jgi:hypothetical protein